MTNIYYHNLYVACINNNKKAFVCIKNKDNTKIKNLETGEIFVDYKFDAVMSFPSLFYTNVEHLAINKYVDIDSIKFKIIAKKAKSKFIKDIKFDKEIKQMQQKISELGDKLKENYVKISDF